MMRSAIVLLALLVAGVAGSTASATPPTGNEVCFVSGVAGFPLDRCLLVGGAGPVWGAKHSRDYRTLGTWAKRWFPVGSVHVGWSRRGEERTVRVKAHHFDGDLGVPIIEFDKEVALAASGPLELHVLPSVVAEVTKHELSILTERAKRLLDRAIKDSPPDWPADGRFELRQPTALAVPGTPGLRTVFLPVSVFGPSKDDRGAFFFLLDGDGKVTFSRFGHGEWSPRASTDEVARFEPMLFFRPDGDSKTYLLVDYQGPWESWGLVALIDPTGAEVVSF